MYVLATTAGEHMCKVLAVFGCAIWALRRVSNKCGTDGMAKSAAKRGIAKLFSRLIK